MSKQRHSEVILQMDHDQILYGTAYYPEYMPYDRIETDVRMMKAAGLNVVRIAESTWSTLEPEDGRFDFSILDETLRALEKSGISAIVGTPTYAIPPWLARKCPDILSTTDSGKSKYGSRQIFDITNENYRRYGERVIRALVGHVKDSPAVIGYQIDNETKYYDNASENVQQMFVQALRRKYGTTDALNRAFCLNYWSNAVHDWDDFPDMTGCVNQGLRAAFDRFRRGLVTEYLQWQADIVAELKRDDQFITHNFDFEWKKFGADEEPDGWSYGVQPDADHYQAAHAVTVAGADIYHPSADGLTGAEIAFCGDSARCLKQDNYFVLETEAQAFKYWTPYPGQVRLQAYSHLAGGADMVEYWHWHSIHNSVETYWKGILGHDLKPNPVYREIARTGNELKKIGSMLCHLKKKNPVAVVVDNDSLTAHRYHPADKELSYNDIVRWVTDSLYEMNLECDVVSAQAMADRKAWDPARYRMIAVPGMYCVTRETVEAIRRYVASGGILLATFRSFIADENLTIYPESLPYGLTDVFGMTWQQFVEPENLGISTVCSAASEDKPQPSPQDEIPADHHGASYTARKFAELLQTEGAEVCASYVHPYWKKYAAVTRNRYGKGEAWYAGCFSDKDFLKDILRKTAAAAGIRIPEAEFPVIIRSGTTPGAGPIHYVFNYSSHPVTIKNPVDTAVCDILTGTHYAADELIRIGDWDLAILSEKSGKI